MKAPTERPAIPILVTIASLSIVACAHQPQARSKRIRGARGIDGTVHLIVQASEGEAPPTGADYECMSHQGGAVPLRARATSVVADELARAGIAKPGNGAADYLIHVRVTEYDGCAGETPQVDAYRAAGLVGASLAGNEYAPQYGVAALDLEIWTPDQTRRLYAGVVRERVTSGRQERSAIGDLAQRALWKVDDRAAQQLAKSLTRLERKHSPYGNLGERCIPRRGEATKGCPSFLTVVVLRSELAPDVLETLEPLGLPVQAHSDELGLAEPPEDVVTIVGVFADPDEAGNWVRAEGLAAQVTLLRTE